jgi:hypothetical protein
MAAWKKGDYTSVVKEERPWRSSDEDSQVSTIGAYQDSNYPNIDNSDGDYLSQLGEAFDLVEKALNLVQNASESDPGRSNVGRSEYYREVISHLHEAQSILGIEPEDE